MQKELLEWMKENLDQKELCKIDLDILASYKEEVFTLILSTDTEKRLPLLKFFAYKGGENPVYAMYQENPLKIIKLGKIIQNAKGKEQALYSTWIAYDIDNKDVLENEEIFDLFKLVANAEEDYQALFGSITARNKNVFKRKDVLQLVESVVKAKGRKQAENGSLVARNNKVLAQENAVQFVDLITNAEEGYQAEYGADIICEDEDVIWEGAVLEKENALDFVKLITTAKKKYQAILGKRAILQTSILTKEDAYDSLKSLTSAKTEEEAQDITLTFIIDTLTDCVQEQEKKPHIQKMNRLGLGLGKKSI